MIWRIGSLFAEGPTISAYLGYGILAENAPADGENGAALGYKPEWFGSEIRFEVVTPPSFGTLDLSEDTSFAYTGTGQEDSFVLQGFVDGIAEAETTTVNLLVAGNGQGVTVIQVHQLTELIESNASVTINISSMISEQLSQFVLVDVSQAAGNDIAAVDGQQLTELVTESVSLQQEIASLMGQQLSQLQIVDPDLTTGTGEQQISLVISQQFTLLVAGIFMVGIDVAAVEGEQITNLVTVSLSGRPIDVKQITFTRLTKQFIFIT